MGAGTFTEAGFPALGQLLHDLLKLAFREGAQGLSLKGALHSGGQGKLGNRRIVGRLNDRDAVVAAHRDVCPLQLAAHRLGRLPYPVVGIALRPALLDALDTLRRVVKARCKSACHHLLSKSDAARISRKHLRFEPLAQCRATEVNG